jgi:hypothetical protein
MNLCLCSSDAIHPRTCRGAEATIESNAAEWRACCEGVRCVLWGEAHLQTLEGMLLFDYVLNRHLHWVYDVVLHYAIHHGTVSYFPLLAVVASEDQEMVLPGQCRLSYC